MESLKKLEDICQPDVRQNAFVRFDDEQCRFRALTLKDFYENAERIQLHDGVPEEVRSHFQTALNLIIYSWFYYPFNVTAELCAYTSAEFALRIKTGDTKGRHGFKYLLKEAIANDWIRDEGFSHVKGRYESVQAYNEGLPPEYQYQQAPLAQEYCKALTDSMPKLRNWLAHGNPHLQHAGAVSVRICADLINQLFERPKTQE